MRVLFILHETGEHSGAWKSARLLLQGLRENHIDCLVLAPDKKELYSELVSNGYRVKAIKIVWNNTKNESSFRYRLSRIPYDIRRIILSQIWFVRVLLIVKRFRPDIIHSNSSVFYLGYDMAKFLNIPHVWHIREFGDLDFNLDISKTRKRLNEHISYNICIARCIQQYRGLCDDPRTTVIYNGILSERELKFITKKDQYFLYVGSLGEGKGIKDIIDAWIALKMEDKDKDFTLRIVGGHENEIIKWGKYISEVSECDPSIVFLGMRNDVGEIMSHARALIVASYSEAFGRVTAESMFNGTVVVGRDTAGTKEQFDNGVAITGGEIAYRFHDLDSLKTCLLLVAKLESKDYETIVRRAQRVVPALYSTEACVNNVLGFYHRIISEYEAN